ALPAPLLNQILFNRLGPLKTSAPDPTTSGNLPQIVSVSIVNASANKAIDKVSTIIVNVCDNKSLHQFSIKLKSSVITETAANGDKMSNTNTCAWSMNILKANTTSTKCKYRTKIA